MNWSLIDSQTMSFGSTSSFRRQGSTFTSMTEQEERRSSSPFSKPPGLRVPSSFGRDGENRSPRRSSPPKRSLTLPVSSTRLSRSRTPIRTSTPNKIKDLPLPPIPDYVPFVPTRSGSPISSIKSRATTGFQDILSSCIPSLSHITPLLVSLGVNSEDHLRAIAKMTDNVRDREVREEAIKKGMTVMEWALLLDKIRSL